MAARYTSYISWWSAYIGADPATGQGGGGSGNVSGPGVSTVNAIALWNNLTGTLLQNSPASINPATGQMSGLSQINLSNTLGTQTAVLDTRSVGGTSLDVRSNAGGGFTPFISVTALDPGGSVVASSFVANDLGRKLQLRAYSSGFAAAGFAGNTFIESTTNLNTFTPAGTNQNVFIGATPIAANLVADFSNTKLTVHGGRSVAYEDTAGLAAVSLRAPAAVVAPYTVTWPAGQGAANSIPRNDGTGALTWVTGAVFGPGVAETDRTIPVWNGTTGTSLQSTNVVISAADEVTTATRYQATNLTQVFDANIQGAGGPQVDLRSSTGVLTDYRALNTNVAGQAQFRVVNDGGLTAVLRAYGSAATFPNALALLAGGGPLFIGYPTAAAVGFYTNNNLVDGGQVARVDDTGFVVRAQRSVFWNDATTHFVSIAAAAASATYTMVWPAAQGVANSGLVNAGTGVLTWGLLPRAGTAALGVGTGTVTINTATITANSIIHAGMLTPSGVATGSNYKITGIANGTPGSFTITAIDLTGATVATDASTVSWRVIEKFP